MSNRQIDKKKLCLMGIDEDAVDNGIQEKCVKLGNVVDFYRITNSHLAFVEYDCEEDAAIAKKELSSVGFKVNFAFIREKNAGNGNREESHSNISSTKRAEPITVIECREELRAIAAKKTDSIDEIESSDDEFVKKILYSSCSVCEKKTHLTCQVCGQYYCSVNCQRIDWIQHKFVCIPMPKLVTGYLQSDSQTDLVRAQSATRINALGTVAKKLPGGDMLDGAKERSLKDIMPPAAAPLPASPPQRDVSPVRPKPHERSISPVLNEPPSKRDLSSEFENPSPKREALKNDADANQQQQKQSPRELAIAQNTVQVHSDSSPSTLRPSSPQILAHQLPRPESPRTPAPSKEVEANPKVVRKLPDPILIDDNEYASDGSRSPQFQRSPCTKRFLDALNIRTPSVHSLAAEFADLLILNNDIVSITEVVSHCLVYVQPTKCTEELFALQQEVFNVTQVAPFLTKYPKTGDILAAPFEGDYYRGRVISVNTIDDMVRIGYIDYGNTDNVPFDKLKELPAPLQEQRRLSMRVTLARIDADIDPDEAKLVKREMAKYMENRYIVKCDKENVEMNSAVELINQIDDNSLNDVLLEYVTCRFTEEDLRFRQVNGDDVQLYIHDTDALPEGRFCAMVSADSSKYKKIDQSLQEYGKRAQTAPAYTPRTHELCVCKDVNCKPNKWYRCAFQQELANDMAEVILIDYGTTRRILMNDIRAFDPSLSIKLYTFVCKIKGCKNISLDDLHANVKEGAMIMSKSIKYHESRNAHIVDF